MLRTCKSRWGVGIILNRFHAFWGLKPRCRLCQGDHQIFVPQESLNKRTRWGMFSPDTLVTSHQEGQLTLISEARTTYLCPEYTLQHLGVIEESLSLCKSFEWNEVWLYSRCDHRKSERIETIGLQNRGRDECCLTPKPTACRAQKSVGF